MLDFLATRKRADIGPRIVYAWASSPFDLTAHVPHGVGTFALT